MLGVCSIVSKILENSLIYVWLMTLMCLLLSVRDNMKLLDLLM
jgi:hypothetical protein